MTQKGTTGSVSFDSHYAALYGDRWESLKACLEEGAPRAFRLNRFVFQDDSPVWRRESVDFVWAPELVLEWGQEIVDLQSGSSDFEAGYRMDPASVVVAKALETCPGESLLDLCAAPGGKSLVLAEAMGPTGTLVANEWSRSRRFKLQSVLSAYLPEDVRTRVSVTGWDGTRVGLYQGERYDRILVDAPCSAEGHLMGRPSELKRWSIARSKQLARRQYAILCSALLAARVGGRIVYATCSLSPDENDGVIARCLKRKAAHVEVVPYEAPIGERTEFGWRILPDRDGAGPAYFAVLQKR